ncbi:MAG: acylneuraminate cytidylyltransferase family protein [Chloroflexota bacterium]
MPRIAALVPMRHISERVPGKNYRALAGKPLYSYILETLLRCPEVSEVVVDTDSPVIREGVQRDFPRVRLIDRPEHLRGGEVSTNEVIRHDVSLVEAPFYLQTHSTNPLLRAETISAAVARFLDAYPDHDSLFSVTRLQRRLWDAQGKAVNHDPAVLLRTQDLPPLYEENSCIYLFEKETFLARRNRIGARPLMFEMDVLESWDIDDAADFEIAEALMVRMQRAHGRGASPPAERG